MYNRAVHRRLSDFKLIDSLIYDCVRGKYENIMMNKNNIIVTAFKVQSLHWFTFSLEICQFIVRPIEWCNIFSHCIAFTATKRNQKWNWRKWVDAFHCKVRFISMAKREDFFLSDSLGCRICSRCTVLHQICKFAIILSRYTRQASHLGKYSIRISSHMNARYLGLGVLEQNDSSALI